MSKKVLSIVGTSLLPPPIKKVRVEACTFSTPPPATSTPVSRVRLKTTMARLERSSLTSFIFRRELGGTSSRVEAVATPTVGSPSQSPMGSSMSPRDVLCTFTKKGDGEVVDEVSSAKTAYPGVPAPIPHKWSWK
ncbi:hypothetical protein AMTR_s00043p00208250 [Amborella trichopoda]|uniref:Uncharacterized protein n=1 Tax=Amborella trichopoda TaxID=13333 RepID=W1PZ15_AMBTC|nr:hypothetical protein AMTR_s00043p00208250 [Amborella trichopoda]